MKKISRLVQLLPNSRLEDLPTHLKGDYAAGILSNWTAAWHPLLISAAQSAPVVLGADQTSVDDDDKDADPSITCFEDEPEEHAPAFDAEFWKDSLVFVPEISLETIAEGFAAKAVGENARLVTGMIDRREIIQRSFELTELMPARQDNSSQSRDRVQSVQGFYSLAYAYLQIQLLTRKIRYSSDLDQNAFDQRLVHAAQAFAAGDTKTCDAAISDCYDLLQQEKNNYYPVQPTLIDLALTTSKTLGTRFDQELESDHIVNLLLTSETLSAAQDSSVEKLKTKLANNRAAVIGGNEVELPDTLLSPETTLRKLKHGLDQFNEMLDYDVSIFMRRRFGLMSSLPNILDQLNFTGAMHTSLDGGKFPSGSFGTIRWAGNAEASILSKAETLLDASDPATMLDLGVKIGRQIDSSHEATCTFAHWPGRTHPSYQDLLGVASRSTVLGEFKTLNDHFETLYDPGYADNFSTEEYASPFLAEAIREFSVVPLTRFVDYWRQYHRLYQLECLIAQWFSALMTDNSPNIRQTIEPWTKKCESLLQRSEALTADWNHDAEATAKIDAEIAEATDELLALFSSSVSFSESNGESQTSVINPLFFTRRVSVSVPASGIADRLSKTNKPYLVQQNANGHLHAVAQCSGSSLTPIASDTVKTSLKKQPAVLEGTKLQNEYFFATIDEKTGALASILYHGKRGNRASQRLVYHDNRKSVASTMVCDTFETSAPSILCGEIKTSGRIVVGQQTVADFTQVFRLTRGQRILELEIEIQPKIEIGNSTAQYFSHRLAWRDEACKISGADQFVRGEIYTPKIQSPNFVEIENLDYTLTLFPGGLPYHNRINRRQLDTLLIVGNEHKRFFKIGIGLDLKYPLKSAIDRACPALTTSMKGDQRQFFHLDSKNLLVTSMRPVFNPTGSTPAINVRLQEMERRGGDVTLFTPFQMAEIHRTNFHGDIMETLHDSQSAPINQIKLSYAAADYFQIRILAASRLS